MRALLSSFNRVCQSLASAAVFSKNICKETFSVHTFQVWSRKSNCAMHRRAGFFLASISVFPPFIWQNQGLHFRASCLTKLLQTKRLESVVLNHSFLEKNMIFRKNMALNVILCHRHLMDQHTSIHGLLSGTFALYNSFFKTMLKTFFFHDFWSHHSSSYPIRSTFHHFHSFPL